MALATVNAKKIARASQLLAVDAADSFLNGLIYTPMNAAAWYDTEARVQGSGSAATVGRFQVLGLTRGVYWEPARSGVGGVFENRGIVAMDIAAATPTMSVTPADTFAVNRFLAGVHKNSGAANAWDAANPFTTGDWGGYYRATNAAVALGETWNSDIYQTQEYTAIAINNSAGSTVAGLIIGALLDPLDTNLSAAETDGRLYGCCVSGGGAVIDLQYWFNTKYSTGTDYFLDHTNTANTTPHHTVFTPGAGTLTQVQRLYRFASNAAADDLNMRGLGGKEMGGFGIPFSRPSGAPARFVGVARGMGVASRFPAGTVLQSGGVDTAYVVFSDSWSSNGAATLLAA